MNNLPRRMGLNGIHPQLLTISLRPEDLIGPRGEGQSCPYASLPPIAQEAFLELKRNTGAPNVAILSWILVAMAAAAMRVARVQPPGYTEDVLALIFITASPSGTGKSLVYERLMQPFEEYDSEVKATHDRLAATHEAAFASWNAEKKGLGELLTKLSKRSDSEGGDLAKEAKVKLEAHVHRRPMMQPYQCMLKTSASAIRILQGLTGKNVPMLLATDEGAKLLKEIIKQDTDLFNQIIDGTNAKHERLHQDLTIKSPLACFALCMTVKQLMAILKKHGAEALGSGLLPRCLIAADRDDGEEEDVADDASWDRLDAFNDLVAKYLREVDRTDGNDVFEPKVLTFSPEATETFKSIKEELKDLRQSGGFPDDYKPFTRKALRLIARIAAIFTVFGDHATSHITKERLTDAKQVVYWYLQQAGDVLIKRPQRDNMQRLIERLKYCYRTRCHYSKASIQSRTMIPKTYLEAFLHMRVDVLDPLLDILVANKVVTVEPRYKGMVYVILNERCVWDQ